MRKNESYHILTDKEGGVLEFDKKLGAFLGYQASEIKALDLHRLAPGLLLSSETQHRRQSCYFLRADGENQQMDCLVHRLDVDDGRYVVISSLPDFVAEFAGFGLEPVLRLILDAQPGNIVLFNRFGAAVWLNQKACTTCGAPLSHLIGRKCTELWPDCDGCMTCEECPVTLAKSSGQMEQIKKQMTGKRWWRITAIPISDAEGDLEHLLFIGEDITAYLLVADEVRQNHKLESLGILAGGIAHDFNNILSGILGYSELALTSLTKDQPAREFIKEVVQAGRRATDLVRQILTFSRRGESQLVATDLARVVEEVVKLLRSSFSAKVQVKKKLEHGVRPVLADPVQMHQVVMNLVTNAAQAMEEEGGELTIKLGPAAVPATVFEQNPDMVQGNYLLLSVQDTGVGMTREVLESMFDPYFTTKPSGRGTGLGLSVVHGIIKECGGHIAVESAPGEGSLFSVYLPTVEKVPVEADGNTAMLLEGTETIMVVDDEPEILKIARTILELHGYTVITETNSQKAIEFIRENSQAVDLLIADITMPNLSGDRLAQECLAIRPDLPIALMTGYTELTADQIRQKNSVKALIMKPLSGKNFLAQIRLLLGNR